MILAGMVLAVLHQDFWLWGNGSLVFGFIPAGMAYQILFSLAAAAFWLACIHWAWPSQWEQWAERPPTEEEGD